MKRFCIVLLVLLTSNLFAGDFKAKVNAASSTTPPSVTLSCSAATTGTLATSFNFYRSTTSGGPYTLLGSSATCAYTDATVAFSTTYFYVSTGVASNLESQFSNQVQAVVPVNPVPNPPTNLTVGAIVARAVPLQWEAPVPQPNFTVTNYTIWRGIHPTLPKPSKIATVKTLSYTDSGCKSAQCYYEVLAVDLQGKTKVVSAPSNIVLAQLQ